MIAKTLRPTLVEGGVEICECTCCAVTFTLTPPGERMEAPPGGSQQRTLDRVERSVPTKKRRRSAGSDCLRGPCPSDPPHARAPPAATQCPPDHCSADYPPCPVPVEALVALVALLEVLERILDLFQRVFENFLQVL